jgi:hypothetical protein
VNHFNPVEQAIADAFAGEAHDRAPTDLLPRLFARTRATRQAIRRPAVLDVGARRGATLKLLLAAALVTALGGALFAPGSPLRLDRAVVPPQLPPSPSGPLASASPSGPGQTAFSAGEPCDLLTGNEIARVVTGGSSSWPADDSAQPTRLLGGTACSWSAANLDRLTLEVLTAGGRGDFDGRPESRQPTVSVGDDAFEERPSESGTDQQATLFVVKGDTELAITFTALTALFGPASAHSYDLVELARLVLARLPETGVPPCASAVISPGSALPTSCR